MARAALGDLSNNGTTSSPLRATHPSGLTGAAQVQSSRDQGIGVVPPDTAQAHHLTGVRDPRPPAGVEGRIKARDAQHRLPEKERLGDPTDLRILLAKTDLRIHPHAETKATRVKAKERERRARLQLALRQTAKPTNRRAGTTATALAKTVERHAANGTLQNAGE